MKCAVSYCRALLSTSNPFFLKAVAYLQQLAHSCSACQGQASPLPPIDDLRRLYHLVKENNPETIWTLLKGDILLALAGVIGADGRPFNNGYAAEANQGRRLPLQVSLGTGRS